MRKIQIVTDIAHKTGVEAVRVKQAVQLALDYMIEALAKEGRLELRDFGVFEVVTRQARAARNPRTGSTVQVPARRKVRFRPGKQMELRVRTPNPPNHTEQLAPVEIE